MTALQFIGLVVVVLYGAALAFVAIAPLFGPQRPRDARQLMGHEQPDEPRFDNLLHSATDSDGAQQHHEI